MSKDNIPPHFVFDKSKEAIFLGKGEVEIEKELQAWMNDFPSDYKAMVMKSACLFKKLNEDSRE